MFVSWDFLWAKKKAPVRGPVYGIKLIKPVGVGLIGCRNEWEFSPA